MALPRTKGLFPEFREMITVARQYQAGEVHFSELNGPVLRAKTAATYLGGHPELKKMADEWELMLHRLWNEWNFLPKDEEITEDEFRTWLDAQLTVFEDFDPVAEAERRSKA